jgi:hypothetical protein
MTGVLEPAPGRRRRGSLDAGMCAGVRRAIAVAAVVAAFVVIPAGAGAQVAGLPVLPIPSDPLGDAPRFEGEAATPNPIGGVPEPPRHPFMAPNGRSNIHNDAYMTDTYRVSGPLGDGTETSTFFARECGSIAFDGAGRIVTVCVGLDRPVLALLDPRTLRTLAALPLPLRSLQSSSGNPFTDFSGGGYFFLDHRDHAVVPTTDRRILDVAITAGPGFTVSRSYSVAPQVAEGDGIVSVLPDWSGRLWFVTRSGLVGTIDRDSGEVRTLATGEGISNSFAVDETGGVFIVSDRALYRFDAGPAGEPSVSWRREYPNSGVRKPGQSDAGSGTTPTLIRRGWVTITDNADPMNVRVYRRGRGSTGREVCAEPVFEPGAGATDQSLIATNRSIIAENNYGYSGPTATEFGGTTSPGLTRVDVDLEAETCRTVWESAERAPSVVPKLSLANGLVYTYTKPPTADGGDPWYLTALDFRDGRTIYRRLAGEGLGYNNNYAPVTIGPDGIAYVGVLGGLVAFP